MESHAAIDRPYRSHLHPACIPCRRRKSRCQTEADSLACLMCKLHKSNCHFPDSPRSSKLAPSSASRRLGTSQRSRNLVGTTAGQTRTTLTRSSRRRTSAEAAHGTQAVGSPQPHQPPKDSQEPRGLNTADDENLNLHIVGPAATDDSRVLTDYLAGVPGAPRVTRVFLPGSTGRSKPVLFTSIQKRPLGKAAHRSPSAEKLEIIEKLLEPKLDQIIDEYFHRINSCMPLLDEDSFRRQLQENREKISPSLLACLYAHMAVYCGNSTLIADRSWPDGRFIWNLANEALYSELHLSPGVSIIAAILLNVGGRPATSLIGNGVLLSSAVSIAHSLGLNYNPLGWNIPESEKHLRINIWWALFVQDKWSSLAHGTPPRITQSQQDVPPPTVQYLCPANSKGKTLRAASIFIALVGLTKVLDISLEHIYNIQEHNIQEHKRRSTPQIESAFHEWADSLVGVARGVVVLGTDLDAPGACNLRLAYLSMKLLLQRIQPEASTKRSGPPEQRDVTDYFQGLQVAEEVLNFTKNLHSKQLSDFWMSVGAFVYPTTVNFLLRHALETQSSPTSLVQSSSFQLARELIDILRLHKESCGWDMGDVCLAQHGDIIDKVLTSVGPENHDVGDMLELQDFIMPDDLTLDQLFPGLWDPLQNAW
ncbi:N-terminal binuclear Zn cluster-containing/DNA binding domain-containing protein [Cordyceps javanica]|uniref:N-terminal binuclear Zn cluster-containing/DNA binding domain-containing protein n=1 Tax=Cordyceps javanica TaxID=43265 RepID=A0A545W580_9HYPO|nr:N-terminal binuclear Zn cluster-containing/DNA binding domain-containing protein [Cordyceps javanica]TQW09045.1 N-terminal binuclear Zn cluster-containing/DNA binding domain-containing protein [Cordyceps javanica]